MHSQKDYPPFNPRTFSLPVNFHHNPNLPEMAMNAPPEGYESSASEGLRFPSRGFFSTTFGKDWQKKEKAFWEEIHSGKYEQKPVILKK